MASGGYLVAGLIDCHIHLFGPQTLAALSAWGVTSGMDMGSPAPLVAALRGMPGVTDIPSPLIAATSPSSAHAARMKNIPAAAEALVGGVADADAWISRRVELGADYVKVVIDLPGFDQATVDALVSAAHAHGLKVIAHASRSDAVSMAQRARVDVLTHVPLDRPIDQVQASQLVASGTVVVPTLTMMQGIVENCRCDGFSDRRTSPPGRPWLRSTLRECRSLRAPTRTRRRRRRRHRRSARVCTTSWRCWSRPGSAPLRRWTPPPPLPRSTSG